MARPPKYPLETLKRHREQKADDATTAFAQAVGVREVAERVREDASRARDEEAARVDGVRAAESNKLNRGELRAADLAWAGAWDVAASHALTDLARAVDEASARAKDAAAREEDARASAAKAMAEREVVARDEARFHDKAKRAADAAQDEDAEEAFRARREG